MNASISLDDNRASSIITFDPSNVITVSNGAIVMVRSRRRNDSSPRTPKLPFAPSAVLSSSDSMPGTFTPQLRAASVYCTSRPRSVEDADIDTARLLGRRRVRSREGDW